MKTKVLLSLLICISISVSALSQATPSYVPTNGLVGWWPFNGNADDASGNGNNGTFSNGSYVPSIWDMAAEFNGNSSLITIPSSSSFDTDSFTFSLRVNLSSHLGHNEIQFGIPGDSLRWSIGWDPNQLYLLPMTCAGTYGTGQNYPQVPINVGTWYHMVFVNHGIYTDYYLDGVFLGTSDMTTPLNCWSPSMNLYLGGDIGGGAIEYFAGLMDECGFWNRALTQQEITNLYNATTSPPCNPLPINLMNGLVGYWPFCGNANDESGNGNNGTVNGATMAADRFSNAGNAFSWNTSPDKIVVPNSNSLQLTSAFSVGLWLKPINNTYGTGPNYHAIVEKWGAANDASYLFELFTNGIPAFRTHNSGSDAVIQARQAVPFDVWTHLLYTQNADTGRLYVNGLLDTVVMGMITPMVMNNDLLFGSNDAYNVGSSGDAYEGLIDDIGIWNRVLSQSEVNQVYNQNICFQTITVTDTLLINVNITNLNPVTYQNTIKVFPNPTNDHITVDFGPNYASLTGYSLRIDNTLGQTMFTSPVQQQSAYIDLNTWTGVGVYFVYLLDAQGHTVDVRKIVLQ
ncbi:MAG: LamG-like jellyroll fold domain-containing protein [Candidatus Pollutiaquabacter aromativorans]